MKRSWTIFALSVATVLVVAACSGSTTTTSTPPPSAAPSTGAAASATPAAPAPSATPSQQALRVGWLSEPDTMNPLTTYATEATEVLQLIYDKLLNYDLQLKPEPELASSFEYSSDGTTVTYHLRSGVKWQDGQPLTADDVAYTYNLIHDNKLGQYAQWLTDLKSVQTPDASTVVLTFSVAQAFNPGTIIPIVPKHIWSAMDAKAIQAFPNSNPIGSGPYKFSQWQKGASLTLTRNPAWWGSPLPSPASITWVLYGNGDVMGQALRSGEVDIIPQVPPTVFDGLVDVANVKTVSLPSFSFHHIGFNVSTNPKSGGNPLLRQLVVRQALEYSVDRKQLVQLCLAGHGQPGSTIVSAGFTDWHLAIPADQQLNNNPAKAKQLLDAAGYTDRDNSSVRSAPDGSKLEFRLVAIATTDVDVCAAHLFQNAAAAVGIKLDFQTLDTNTLGSTVYNSAAPNWDIFVWGWDTAAPDPGYILGVPTCNQIGGNNDVYYCNKQYDALYAQQAVTLDPTGRKAITDQMQQMYYNDAAYLVMWYQDKLQAYRTDTWTNWTPVPGGMIFNFTRENYLQIRPAH